MASLETKHSHTHTVMNTKRSSNPATLPNPERTTMWHAITSMFSMFSFSWAARYWALAAALLLGSSVHGQSLEHESVVLIPWTKAPKEVPVFYSVNAKVDSAIELDHVRSSHALSFRVLQGQPKVLSVALIGNGEVIKVEGAGIKDWSVRVASDGKRFLDIHPAPDAAGKYPEALEVKVQSDTEFKGGTVDVLLPGPASAAGYSMKLALQARKGVAFKLMNMVGLLPLEGLKHQYLTTHEPQLRLKVAPEGARMKGLEMLDSNIMAVLAKDGRSMNCRFTGRVRAEENGSRIELLGGKVSLNSGLSGDGWRVELKQQEDKSWGYDLVADRGGEFDVGFAFDVPVDQDGDWRRVAFLLPAGVVVPVELQGFEKDVTFSGQEAVFPRLHEQKWVGYLPANGNVSMVWRNRDKVKDGSLFFSSSEITDVRVGSGLMRLRSLLDLKVLQGKLHELRFEIHGKGEVLTVAGDNVIGWKVSEKNGQRFMDVQLSRPIEKSDRLMIECQVPMQGAPLQAGSIRLSPLGSLRHSGWLRVANEGSVRIEVKDTKGLIQLAPHQFPAPTDKGLRQVVVYRFPSAEFSYGVQASQVLPEVSLSEVTVYELGETDLSIATDLEIDIHEAPLREWSLMIPDGYAVSSVAGANIADFAVGTELSGGMRPLTILFKGPVIGRQLIQVVMAKNQSPKPGDWVLQPLRFHDLKSHRGYIGVVAAAGFRIRVDKDSGLAEIPLTFFPKKSKGLQQAFRMREPKWDADLEVEALGQSIQADVFHLYSLKSGVVYGSVLINYFVVGAPASEWRISVPEGIGNVDVTGQNVGHDWRRAGNEVIVPLSRPVLGAGTVLLTFEQPMNSRGGTIAPGAVQPLGVQSERGIVQVVSPLQVNHTPTIKGSLLKIDSSEIPTEFRLLSTAPTLEAWQYTARDFEISLDIEWFEPGETSEQVVDFQKLNTHVSRDGQWVTDCRAFVKTRGRSVLRLQLPATAILWEAKVNGEAVNARADGEITLIPLSKDIDPNKSIEVALRFGAQSDSETSPSLSAPVFDVPVVVGEWTVTGDEGRKLVPRGGSASLVRPVMTPTGWEWLADNQALVIALLVLGLATMIFAGDPEYKVRAIIALVTGFGFLLCALIAALTVTTYYYENTLEYAAPVVGAGQAITVEIGNLPEWQANTGFGVWLGFIAGVAISVWGWMKRDRWMHGVGLIAVTASFLSIHGGVSLFLLVLALIGGFWWIPMLIKTISAWRKPKAAAAAAVMALCFGLMPGQSEAASSTEIRAAESIVQQWQIKEQRLYGTIDIAVRGETGERFLLLKEPAVISKFDGEGLKVVKAAYGNGNAYWIETSGAGRLTAKVTFEMPLANPNQGWALPTGAAAVQHVTVRWDQAGWEFFSPAAAKITPLEGLGKQESGAFLAISPVDDAVIQARAVQRDVSAEETRFYAEVANLYIPGPGVVNGTHRVSIRPAQGQVSSVILRVPVGFTVSDVLSGPVGKWRFDPETMELRVQIEPAQMRGFAFTVETQRSAGDLPVDLKVEPLRVMESAGEVGMIGLAFGDEVQPEGVKPVGLSKVNPEDFGSGLIPRGADKQPLALLLHAFRYGASEASVSLRVNPVAPELRAHASQLVSLGEDRLVVTSDLEVTITRAGVFQLVLDLPAHLEVETATGSGLSHWTQSVEGVKRTVILHLNGKTMGKQQFSLTLVGRPTGEQEKWDVPKIQLQGASRETGMLTIVPERGLRVRAVERRNVALMDPRELAGLNNSISRASVKPEALSYRLLQGDWKLGLSIRKLEAWVTARVFHDVTIREGQMITKLDVAYRIDNASVKSQQIRIHGLDEKSAATVRASGAAVADLVPVEGKKDLWEVRFQRGIAGNTNVAIEYQRLNEETSASIQPIELVQVRQVDYILSLRAGGRLELETGELPRGWTRSDWTAVQVALGEAGGGEPPNMTFRVADAEGPLPVNIKRHALADLRKVRVSQGMLTTLMSSGGNALTAVSLNMKVVGKSTMRLKLPEGAELFNVFVNNEGAPLVRKDGEWLFYVFPSPDTEKDSEVRFVYASKMIKGKQLEGPVLDVPMENLTWRVLVPEGWRVADTGGDFDLKMQEQYGEFRVEDYQQFVASKQAEEAQMVVQQLDQANDWLEKGDQRKASQALSSVLNKGNLDAASSEDARVQLRRLKTQQAVLGLNSRRQKMMLDNRYVAEQQEMNPQITQAANANPVLLGQYNYDPKQFDSFLEGNTADENAALKAIANRIVGQQLAAEPAPAALDLTLPERGTVLSFGRSVQMDSDAPMTLEIVLEPTDGGFSWLPFLLCLLAGALAVRPFRRLAA